MESQNEIPLWLCIGQCESISRNHCALLPGLSLLKEWSQRFKRLEKAMWGFAWQIWTRTQMFLEVECPMVCRLSGPPGLLGHLCTWPARGADLSEAVTLPEIAAQVESVQSPCQARLVHLLLWCLWLLSFPEKTPAQSDLFFYAWRRPWCLLFRVSPRRGRCTMLCIIEVREPVVLYL